jgi:hypothetical protein
MESLRLLKIVVQLDLIFSSSGPETTGAAFLVIPAKGSRDLL